MSEKRVGLVGGGSADKVTPVQASSESADERRQELAKKVAGGEKQEDLGKLAGIMALEFNNLLTAIHGYVDLNLPEIPEESQLYQDLLQIKKAAEKGGELSRRLLALSDLEVPEL